MKNLPQPFWAIGLALLGVIVCLACLFRPGPDKTVTMGVLAIASNLVAGALGAFAGHASPAKSDVTAVNSPTIISPDA